MEPIINWDFFKFIVDYKVMLVIFPRLITYKLKYTHKSEIKNLK
jgi:hypothetical protein